MKVLVLDFESRDPYIKLGYGAGWVFSLHVQTSIFKLLGYSHATYDMETGELTKPDYVTDLDKNKLEKLLADHNNTVVMHNAPYDLGCLLVMGIDIKRLKVYDTMIIAKLYDNRLMSYSLDNLSKRYLQASESKAVELLIDSVIRTEISGINPDTKTARDRIKKWAYENLDLVQSSDLQAVADYANQDIIATANLFKFQLSKKGIKELADRWCKFQVILTCIRAKGIRVDMSVVNEGCDRIKKLRKEAEDALAEMLPGVAISSNQKLGQALKLLGYKLPTTPTGQYRTDKEVLEKYKDDKIIAKILRWKEVDKIGRDFFEKIRDMQMYSCPEALEGAPYGRVFPDLNLFGASATGRFSSSNPNIQQIPSKSDEFGDLCRAMFVPNKDGNLWISADWSNQEGRLQIHYADVIKADGVSDVVNGFKANPRLDLHQKVADLASIKRSEAKAINLGLAYGMGSAKLARALGFGTRKKTLKNGDKIEVADECGQYIIDQYHKNAPYLRTLMVECMNRFKMRGFVKTLGGRVLQREDPKYDYKALNKLIQGSAADQCLLALEAAWDAGLEIINLVHDEFNIEGTEEDIKKLVYIMENVVKLSIPVIAEVEVGSSWGTIKPYKE